MQRDLVLSAKAGNLEAFTALAAGSIARLHRIARLILRDDDLASDAVQDALISAWLDIRAVRDPDRFDAWLHRLLLRSCYRTASRHRRIRALEVRVEAVENLRGAGDDRDAGRDLVARDQVDRGFRRLPPDLRAVLVVHHYLGLRDGEAAEVLGIPVGTFKSRLNRATNSLRAAIEADDRMPDCPSESIA